MMNKSENSNNAARPVHGGLNVAELEALGLKPEEVVDFSASINPLGTSPRVLEAAMKVNLATYPDPECTRLREAIGSSLGVPPECILAGNGSTELIHLLARACLDPDDTAVIFAPTFGEYDAACRIQGVAPVSLSPPNAEIADRPFHWDLEGAIATISTLRPALVFLCNPNNPTGVYLREHEVRSIAESLRGIGLLALDEAYVSFVDGRWDATPLLSQGNVVLLRSMTKDYALTGLRLGYMLATPDTVERVRSYQYSWSVNAPAQAAGIASIPDTNQVERGRDVVREGKRLLMETAQELGLDCAPSMANFLTVRVGKAAEVRMRLLTKHGICVRDCTSFGLPEYIRVGVRTMEDNKRLAAALADVIAGRDSVG